MNKLNIQNGTCLRTVYVIFEGRYDSKQIIGVYSHKEIAQQVMNNISSSDLELVNFEVETSANIFTIFEQNKHDNILSEIREKKLTAIEFKNYIGYNTAQFHVKWPKGFKSYLSEEPRKFGSFNAWGCTREECEDNMKQGLKICDEYDE